LCHTARILRTTLNWRRDPDDERRMSAIEIEIARIKSDSEQIEKETEQL